MIEDAKEMVRSAEELLTDGQAADEGMSALKGEADQALSQSKEAVQECTDLIGGMFPSAS